MTTVLKDEKYEHLLEKVPCNLCGKDDHDVVYPPRYELAQPKKLAEVFRSSGDDILLDQLVRCRSCGLQYLNPRLRQNIIIDGYSAGEDPLFVSQAKARERTFGRCLRSLMKYHPKPGKILDVGTASGAFLKVAKDAGWDVQGCEPNVWMTEWCQKNYGIKVFPGTIFEMNLPDNHFDAVSLWDVLEHTTDPKKVLEECRRVLKKDGLLIVNYPDIGSLPSRAMGKKWVFLLSIHLYYFTPATIQQLLKDVGFQPLKFRTHWQSLELGYIFFRMKPYIAWAANLGIKISEALRIQSLPIPYWMGQTLVIARKT